MFSMRLVINSCCDVPQERPERPRWAASYSALICDNKRATSLRCSWAPSIYFPFPFCSLCLPTANVLDEIIITNHSACKYNVRFLLQHCKLPSLLVCTKLCTLV